MQSSGTNKGNIDTPLPASTLIDNHGRPITYLRLAITDRCNLRCSYCMPEQGITPIPHSETLSYEELEHLVDLFVGLGIDKVRLTGGEPFARRGCLEFMQRLKGHVGVKQIFLTTNGVETARYLDSMKEMGISGINLSLDTLNKERFKEITRRDHLHRVLETLYRAIELDIPLKINTVVSEDTRDEEIVELGSLVRRFAISLRFIEKMPFSGEGEVADQPAAPLRERLSRLFPGLRECQTDSVSTALLFNAPEFIGTIGVIEGKSRRFCNTCNKIRITPQGMLKACLYDNGVLDLKEMLRSGVKDKEIIAAVRSCLNRRYADGHETESVSCRAAEPSMASIGG